MHLACLMPNALLEAALQYASRGWRVFPLRPGTKLPLQGSSGFKDATTDPDTIHRWWTEDPTRNVAIATGPESNLLVVDLDVKPDKDGTAVLSELERVHGDLPPAPLVSTANGGVHAFYAYPPEGASSGANVAGPGIDIRAAGGYVVAAPSVLADGGEYDWMSKVDILTVPPAWVYKKPSQTAPAAPTARDEAHPLPPAPPAVLDAARARLARHGPAVEGNGGDQHTFAACAVLRHDYALSETEAWPLLQEWNETCDPPWDEGQLWKKLANAGSYAKGDYGARRREAEAEALMDGMFMVDVPTQPEPTDPFELEVKRVHGELTRLLGASAGKRIILDAPERFDHTRSKPRKPRQWVADGLLKECLTLLSGHEKSTKTWLACGIAVAVASGQPFAGEFKVSQPGPVVLLLTEDEEDEAAARIDALITGLGLNDEERAATWANIHGWYTKRITVTDNAELSAFIARCSLVRPKLVVMDPLVNLHGEEEQSASAMNPVMSRFFFAQQILGCSLLLTHHAGKPSEAGHGRRAQHKSRGSTVITAVPPGLISYDSTDDTEAPHAWKNVVVVTARGGAAAGKGTLKLEVDDFPGTRTARCAVWSWSREVGETAGEQELSKVAARVRDVLELAHRKAKEAGGRVAPMSVRAMAPAVPHRRSLIQDALSKQLEPQGVVKWHEDVTNPRKSGWLFVEVDQTTAQPAAHVASAFIEEEDK
jgi:hypothetical protein